MSRRTLYLSGDPEADALLTKDPLALLVGMVLDQQVPLERAFRSPLDLQERLDAPLDAATLAAMDPDRLADIFAERPALHRFPRSMAGRVQEVSRVIVDEYDGDPAAIWTSAADGKELLRNVSSLPGFGQQKARIFVALLGKQLGVRPRGWREAAGPFGVAGSFRSIADIDSPTSLAKVRQFKQEAKAAAKAGAAKAGAAKSGTAKSGTAKAGAAKAGTPKTGTPKTTAAKKTGTAKAAARKRAGTRSRTSS